MHPINQLQKQNSVLTFLEFKFLQREKKLCVERGWMLDSNKSSLCHRTAVKP